MRIFFAPMEGVVDHHMRDVMRSIGGIDICVTEFIRVTNTVLPRKVFVNSCPELLERPKPEIPTRVQLLGSNPEMLAINAKKAAKFGAPAIDLNFGCPAKTVNRHKGGACLLDDSQLLFDIVSTVRKHVPVYVPVTAKIRLGYENRDSYKENAQALYEAGASELVVHARSKSDGYRPPAYWDCIGEIRELIPIPVVANGEIWSLDDFKRCKQQSGCEDFMLGRGLLAKPDLAIQIKAYLNGEDYKEVAWGDIAKYLYDFFLITCEAYPKKYTGNRAKQWLHYLSRQYPEAKILFEQIKTTRDFETISTSIKSHFS